MIVMMAGQPVQVVGTWTVGEILAEAERLRAAALGVVLGSEPAALQPAAEARGDER
jgi:hypothetical protein